MTEFSRLIAERWNIPEKLARDICDRFGKGYASFYLSDHVPHISAEVDDTQLAQICAFLQSVTELSPKKKRAVAALKKADALTEETENRISLSTDASEIDDIVLPFRPNPRSKAQIASKKGLGPLADTVEQQEIEEGTVEELAQKYVGKDPSLKTMEDVLAGVRDILSERFAYDETVRSMVRDFGWDDGFFEIQPRNKRDRKFAMYRGKMVSVTDLKPEESLSLFHAEDTKQIRFKHSVQLFTISEFLRQHIIVNPDSVGFDLICESIDDCWNRLLQPVVERYVKNRLRSEAEDWAIAQISDALDSENATAMRSGPVLAVGLTAGGDLVIVALNDEGHLLGATQEKIKRADQPVFSNRLHQFVSRHRPTSIVVYENDLVAAAEGIVKKSCECNEAGLTVTRRTVRGREADLVGSSWMQEKYADLDDTMKTVYAAGLLYLQPLSIIPVIGSAYFKIHSLQELVREEMLTALVARKITERALRKGIPVLEAPDSVLKQLPGVPEDVLAQIRRHAGKEPLGKKDDLLSVEGMTQVAFANIAGYIVINGAQNVLDRIAVHPEHFEWIGEMAEELNVSVETVVIEPEQLRSATCDDPARRIFIEKKLIGQLRHGQSRLSQPAMVQAKRLRLSDIAEGVILPGRVTNITPFGVFVDINAACDGLVHISQLADGFVESAEQVVSVGDKVDVRVIVVDPKKRRISLSMKNLGQRGRRISPTQAQLSTLADHFKSR